MTTRRSFLKRCAGAALAVAATAYMPKFMFAVEPEWKVTHRYNVGTVGMGRSLTKADLDVRFKNFWDKYEGRAMPTHIVTRLPQ